MDANDIITVKLHIAHMEGLMMPFMAEITSLAETVLFRLEFEWWFVNQMNHNLF